MYGTISELDSADKKGERSAYDLYWRFENATNGEKAIHSRRDDHQRSTTMVVGYAFFDAVCNTLKVIPRDAFLKQTSFRCSVGGDHETGFVFRY